MRNAPADRGRPLASRTLIPHGDRPRGACSNPEMPDYAPAEAQFAAPRAARTGLPRDTPPRMRARGGIHRADASLFAPEGAVAGTHPPGGLRCFSFQGALEGNGPPESAVRANTTRFDMVRVVHPKPRLPWPWFAPDCSAPTCYAGSIKPSLASAARNAFVSSAACSAEMSYSDSR